jgi:tetratricopeptide (TPR) repeat protein
MKDYIQLGKDALDSYDFLNAQKYFNAALEKSLDSYELFLFLGILNNYLKHFDVAHMWFDKAINLDSTRSEAFFGKAKIYNSYDDATNLIKYLNLVLKKEPSHDGAHLMLAKYYEKSGNYPAAIGSYFAVINLTGDTFDICFSLSLIYNEINNNAYALEFIDRALRIEPHNYKALFNRGVIFQKMGFPEKACSSYIECFTANPNYIPSYINLSSIYCQYNQVSKAFNIINRGIFQNPETAELIFNRAILNALTNNKDATSEDIESCITLDSNYIDKIKNHDLLKHFH